MSEQTSPYTVLARRFRPQSFSDVVGQEHVAQAIQNAIRTGRVAHAYLFTGARGVGKTSTARIFAKALNCPHVVDGVPCNQCDVCQRIAAGNDVDVLEIDGASNRGIDDIRQLRANVSVRSMRSPNKVYIIDEVHMLTKEAFNALLKTLEEPPPNVKFVFCTTEPNKVPDTILSRCQRFDFGTIGQDSIALRLKQIAEAEGKQVDDEAIELVARRAAGSMRDSQSLFDQLLAFGSEKITAADVHQLLGTAPDDRLIDLVEALIETNPGRALELVENALRQGVQIGSLSDQLLAYLRDLLVTAAGAGEVPLSSVTDTSRPRVQAQAKRWGLQSISAAMQILADTKARMQRANYARALMDLALVRIGSLEQLDQIAALLQGVVRPTAAAPAPARAVFESQQELKKNGEPLRAVNRTAAPAPLQTSDPKAEKTPQHIEIKEDNINIFWENLLAELPDALTMHLKNSSRIAISGPNLLEIWFPTSYLFSKNYCERSETKKRLAAAAENFCGHSVDWRFSVDKTVTPPAFTNPRPAETKLVERRKPSCVEGDFFVQQAVAIFGGQVVEVRPLATPTAQIEESDPIAEE
jgi:DNA polymerase-3 subunit gamma/tau